jgi:hypothetical protein
MHEYIFLLKMDKRNLNEFLYCVVQKKNMTKQENYIVFSEIEKENK